jgi:hypothetical protein
MKAETVVETETSTFEIDIAMKGAANVNGSAIETETGGTRGISGRADLPSAGQGPRVVNLGIETEIYPSE